MTDTEQPSMDTVVTMDWLSQHLDDPDLVVLDYTVRVEMGGEAGQRENCARSSRVGSECE